MRPGRSYYETNSCRSRHARGYLSSDGTERHSPVEFDFLYMGRLVIDRSSSQDEIKRRCPPTTFPYHLGCGGPQPGGWCHILMADDETIRKYGWTPEIVLRHEMGHCNGWTLDHKGTRKP